MPSDLLVCKTMQLIGILSDKATHTKKLRHSQYNATKFRPFFLKAVITRTLCFNGTEITTS